MADQFTITVTGEVYRGLQAVAGTRTINELLEDLTRSMVDDAVLEAGYREMAADEEREREAAEWIEGLIYDPSTDECDAAR